MTKKVFIVIGILLLVAGAGIGAFTGLDVALWLELAGAAATLALCITSLIKKAKEKDWKLYTSICGVVVGTVLLVFAGIAPEVVTSVITGVIGLVVLIASILIPAIMAKKIEK